MPRQRDPSLPDELSLKLALLKGHVRRLALLRGIGVFALVLAAGMAVGLLIDLQWELSVGTRIAGLVVFGLVCTVVFIQAVVRPWFRKMNLAELAAVVEQAHPDLSERLTSTVELHDPDVPDAHKGSDLMRDLLTRQTLRSVDRLDFTASVPGGRSIRMLLLGGAALVLVTVPFLWFPSGYGLLWSRFFVPWGNFDRAGNLHFHVVGGDRVVARGSDVAIRVEPRWRGRASDPPPTLRLNWTDSAAETDSRSMPFDRETESWGTTVPHVFNAFEFNVSAAGGRSRNYRIDVVEPPTVTEFRLDAEPPAYTGLPAALHDGVVGEVSVFERSRLKLRLVFNKPVANAELVWFDAVGAVPASGEQAGQAAGDEPQSAGPPTESSEQVARTPFVLSRDRESAVLELSAIGSIPAAVEHPFAIRLTDEYGLQNLEEPRRSLVISPDQPPQLQVAGSDEPQPVRPDDIVEVSVTADDDIGLGALELHYETASGDETMLPVDPSRLGGRSLSHEFQLDPASLGISEGSVLAYRVRAADERPVPGPNEVWSERRVLLFDSNADPLGSSDAAERQRDLKQLLEGIRSDLTENREQVADLHDEADDHLQQQSEFERNEELPPLADQQGELAKRIERLATRFAEHPLFASLTAETRQVAREDLSESSTRLREAAAAPLAEKADTLKKNTDHLAHADEKLRDIGDRFDQLAEIEQDLLELQRLARQAERLAEEARTVEQRRHNPPPDETDEERQAREQQLADEQQALQEQQQELSRQVNDLLERRPELVDAARKHQLDRLASLSEQALDLAEPQDLLAEALQGEAEQPDAQDGPNPIDEPDGHEADPQLQQDESLPDARQVQTEQQQLAREAAELALEVARQTGPDSPAAQQAAEFARLSGG